jgi:hypothetical protein
MLAQCGLSVIGVGINDNVSESGGTWCANSAQLVVLLSGSVKDKG